MKQQSALTNLTARLDRLPWSRFHTIVTLALGIAWMLDSFEINIIGSVLGILSKNWHLNAVQGSYALTAWLGGILVGALLFGYLTDYMGRKRLFYVTLIWYAAFTVMTAFSWNYGSLLFFRFMTALGVGGEYSAITAAMGEFLPKKNRGKTDALIMAFNPVGAVLSALAALYFLNVLPPDVGWRVGFGLGAVLAVVALWARTAIPESPRWLIVHGRSKEAEEIVGHIERRVEQEQGIRLEPVKVAVPVSEKRVAVGSTFGELATRYLGRTAFASALNFSQAAILYGALSFMAVAILPGAKVPAQQMPIYYLIANIGAIVGGLVAALLLDSIGRKTTVLAGYALATLSILVLAQAGSPAGVLWGYSLLQFAVTWSWVSAYVATAETFPTSVRATGLGISVAFGRVGAGITPVVLASVFSAGHQAGPALTWLVLFALPGPLAALIWAARGIEGKHRSLEELDLTPLPAEAEGLSA